MASDDTFQLRQELWRQFSKRQIEILRGLRAELSSRRWEMMLEIDAIQSLVRVATVKAGDPDQLQVLSEAAERLDGVHRQLARVPEDFIPAF